MEIMLKCGFFVHRPRPISASWIKLACECYAVPAHCSAGSIGTIRALMVAGF